MLLVMRQECAGPGRNCDDSVWFGEGDPPPESESFNHLTRHYARRNVVGKPGYPKRMHGKLGPRGLGHESHLS